jgi:hypothetical protein
MTFSKATRLKALAIVGFVALAIAACSKGTSSRTDDEYCGHSFCIGSVAREAVTVTMPVVDVRRYQIQTPAGPLILVESNFPELGDAIQSPATELPNLRAWHLSPAAHPACLIFVGAKWPHWIIAWIEGEGAERADLVDYLRRVRITATSNTTMEGIEFPTSEEPRTD